MFSRSLPLPQCLWVLIPFSLLILKLHTLPVHWSYLARSGMAMRGGSVFCIWWGGFFGGWLVCFSDVFQITVAENELFILSTKWTCLTPVLGLKNSWEGFAAWGCLPSPGQQEREVMGTAHTSTQMHPPSSCWGSYLAQKITTFKAP